MSRVSLGLRSRLLLVILIPCLAIAGLLVERAVQRRAQAREANELALLIQLAVATGDLLHETQKERGSSSVFMSSGGTKFVRELEAQRTLTDDRRMNYLQLVRKNEATWPPAVAAALQLTDGQLTEIEARRRQVTDLSVPVPEIIGYYNDLNRRLLASVASVAAKSPNADLRAWSIGYLAFLHAKEHTGIERAQLSNVFGTDRFAPGQFFTVASVVATQKAYLQVFEVTAPEEVVKFYQERARHPAFAEVKAKEQIAFEGGQLGAGGASRSGFGVESSAWFQLMTQKINLMKEVEEAAARVILSRAGQIQAEAGAAFRQVALLGVALLVLVVAVAFVASSRVVMPIRKLTQVADRVSSGDLELEVKAEGTGEIRELSESFRRMVNSLKMMRALQQRKNVPGRLSGSRPILAPRGRLPDAR